MFSSNERCVFGDSVGDGSFERTTVLTNQVASSVARHAPSDHLVELLVDDFGRGRLRTTDRRDDGRRIDAEYGCFGFESRGLPLADLKMHSETALVQMASDVRRDLFSHAVDGPRTDEGEDLDGGGGRERPHHSASQSISRARTKTAVVRRDGAEFVLDQFRQIALHTREPFRRVVPH